MGNVAPGCTFAQPRASAADKPLNMTRRTFALLPFALILAVAGLTACGATAPRVPKDPSTESGERTAAELFRIGKLAADRGDTVRAEQYLAMSLERGFDEAKVLPIMLRVCLSSSRVRAALNYAEHYLREHPDDVHLRYLVATLHLGLRQYQEARLNLQHLLRVAPNNADAYYLLGILESDTDDAEAVRDFRKYLELAPHGQHSKEVDSRLTDLMVRSSAHQDSRPAAVVIERTAKSESASDSTSSPVAKEGTP